MTSAPEAGPSASPFLTDQEEQMKKKAAVFLLALMMMAPFAGLAAPFSLEGLSLQELSALRQEADARIRLMQLPDAEGYQDIADGEALARTPEAYLQEKVRLIGDILRVEERAEGFRYFLSLRENPGRIFLVDYVIKEDHPLLLAGDEVVVHGVFEGLMPFSEEDPLTSGAPVVAARLVAPRVAEAALLAAPPYAATKADPAPLGVTARYDGSYWSGYAAFEMEMLHALRGAAALSWAQELTKYNVTPLKTQEYLLIWIRVKAQSAPGGKAEISEGDFNFVSASGREYLPHYLLNATEPLGNLYEGGEQRALIACIIDKGDQPLVVYQPRSESPLWFDPNSRHVTDLSGQAFSAIPLNASAPEVVRMKALLAEMGFLKKLDTGDKFTSGLSSALKEYQRAMGLDPSGKADEISQRLLLSGAYPPGL